MIEEADVRELLGLLDAGASSPTVMQLEQLLRFKSAGSWRYPAFQFDGSNRRVYLSFVRIHAAARAAERSNFRLLNWMMRPHMDFERLPAASLSERGEDVLMAFLRETTSEYHG